jgi:hypothetical protein
MVRNYAGHWARHVERAGVGGRVAFRGGYFARLTWQPP